MSKKQKATLTNAEISASSMALNKLGAATKDVVLSYRIAQNAKPLAEMTEAFNTAQRDALKHGGAKIDGDRFVVENGRIVFETPEQEVATNAAIDELAQMPNDIEYYPLSLARLASVDVAVDYNWLVPLQWMIADDVE